MSEPNNYTIEKIATLLCQNGVDFSSSHARKLANAIDSIYQAKSEMALRDSFAAKAMTAMIPIIYAKAEVPDFEDWEVEVANHAYFLADMMIQKRNEPEEDV